MNEPQSDSETLEEPDPETVDLPTTLIAKVLAAVGEGRHADVLQLLEPLHSADLADLLQMAPSDDRAGLVEILRHQFDPQVLSELDDPVRGQVIDQLGLEKVAEALIELETDDALDVLEELEEAEQQEVLDALPYVDRSLIVEGLAYPTDSAGRLMQREVVAVPQHWSVGQAIDFMRDADDLPNDFFDLFLVDAARRPIGAVPLSRVMRANRQVALAAIMSANLRIIPAEMDQEEVAFLFRQRDLISAPVTSEDGRLVGVITIDDIVDVIHEEHEEDILRLGGVGQEDDLFAAVLKTTRSRSTWLGVHLVAAFASAWIISLFAETIEELVALAILMPIVAAMGGTAGVQSLTVAVRAIAMKELTPTNALRTIGKELIVGGLNGVLFAILIGGVAWTWFGSPALGGIIGLAVILNLLVAGLAGSALPLILQRLGFDPAVASSAVLISITDVAGFYIFLSLAAVLLL